MLLAHCTQVRDVVDLVPSPTELRALSHAGRVVVGHSGCCPATLDATDGMCRQERRTDSRPAPPIAPLSTTSSLAVVALLGKAGMFTAFATSLRLPRASRLIAR